MSGAVRRWAARRRYARNDTTVNETGICYSDSHRRSGSRCYNPNHRPGRNNRTYGERPNVDTKCRGIRATIGYATQFDLSLDLTALAANASRLSTTLPRNILRRLLPLAQKTNLASILVNDPMLQAQAGDSSMPAPIANFEGMPNWNNLYPPDTEGDIGFDPSTGKKYYLPWVNTSFAIWM